VASLGTVDQIILNNTGDMSEEEMKALQEVIKEMFEDMKKNSGKADTAEDSANTPQTGKIDFKVPAAGRRLSLKRQRDMALLQTVSRII